MLCSHDYCCQRLCAKCSDLIVCMCNSILCPETVGSMRVKDSIVHAI